MMNNKLVIAAAGSGKTSLLVKKAKEVTGENVLITTYTEANKAEIEKKFNGDIPSNITIQTWFSFLLKHGVKPYQSEMCTSLHERKIGFFLTGDRSGKKRDCAGNPILVSSEQTGKNHPIFFGERDFFKFYFTENYKIYSDKISKFVVSCNKRLNGEIVNRISRIYPTIYIDEIQDLAGWELELIKLFFQSGSTVLLVGDPRQVTYLTHHATKYKIYRNGMIKEFVQDKCNTNTQSLCDIDESSLRKSHRNNAIICSFSSRLYPNYMACEACKCTQCRENATDHEGVFLLKPEHVEGYRRMFSLPQVLRYSKAKYPELNYGNSKGLGFDRIIIYPTKKILEYLKHGDVSKLETIRAKFYVAITRAKNSVAIVCDFEDIDYIDGLIKYEPKA